MLAYRHNVPSTKRAAASSTRIARFEEPSPPKAFNKVRRYDWDHAENLAAEGTIPQPPDFGAKSRQQYRPVLNTIVAFAKAGELEALRKAELGVHNSPTRAIDRYRRLCIVALSNTPITEGR